MNPVAPTPSSPVKLAYETDFFLGAMGVRPSLCEVSFGDETQRLEPRVMQVLVSLAQAQPAVLTRDDLIAGCWGGVVVGDDAIQRVIGKLRRLSSQVSGGFIVETVPRVGYRLRVGPGPPANAPERDVATGLSPRPSGDDGRPLIALLPFDRVALDGDPAFLVERVVTRIFEALSRSSWLSVVSRQSVAGDRSGSLEAPRVAAELGVQYLVCGQSRLSADTLRIAMKLIDGRDDELVWSEVYQRREASAFDDDDEIARQVVSAVETALLGREQQRTLRTGSTSGHWDLFMRGRWHIWRSTRRSNALGQALLVEALALRPDDMPTLSMLVFAKVGAIWAGWVEDPVRSRIEAEKLALKAVAIDPDDAFAHFANGSVLALSDRLERAEAEQRRALELNPHFDLASGELGRLLVFSGKTAEGEGYTDRAISASPSSPHIALWTRDKAVARFIDGRFDDAAAFATEACAKRPNWFLLHYFRAACLAAAERMEEAHDALAQGRRLLTPYPFEMLRAAHPFVRTDDMARFLAALRSAGWDD